MTLFCDFDGPIVDVSSRYYATYCLALARTRRAYCRRQDPCLTPLTKVQFWRMKQQRRPDSEIAHRSGLQADQVDRFLAEVQQIVNCCPHLLRRDAIQPQVPAALALLRRHGIQPVLVTLRCESQVRSFLARYGLGDAFAAIYGTQDRQAAYSNYGDVKTALLGAALADHGSGQEDWMVGDTEADVIAAQRLGLKAIALTCGIRSHSYLRALRPSSLQPNLLVLAQSIHQDLELDRAACTPIQWGEHGGIVPSGAAPGSAPTTPTSD
ncbi:MAG: HAD family hydrolase [Synechococcales cyanobacterium RM1_1_8]|nr:HAD family hydrolase [Synechococcales cyanobacterium RM1_1_8]